MTCSPGPGAKARRHQRAFEEYDNATGRQGNMLDRPTGPRFWLYWRTSRDMQKRCMDSESSGTMQNSTRWAKAHCLHLWQLGGWRSCET